MGRKKGERTDFVATTRSRFRDVLSVLDAMKRSFEKLRRWVSPQFLLKEKKWSCLVGKLLVASHGRMVLHVESQLISCWLKEVDPGRGPFAIEHVPLLN